MTVSKHLFRRTPTFRNPNRILLELAVHRERGKKALPTMLGLTPAPHRDWISSDSQL
jgi:hypothetical protein